MFSLTSIFSILVLVIFIITGVICVYLYSNREKGSNTKPDWRLITSFLLQVFLIILFFTSSLGSLPEAINYILWWGVVLSSAVISLLNFMKNPIFSLIVFVISIFLGFLGFLLFLIGSM